MCNSDYGAHTLVVESGSGFDSCGALRGCLSRVPERLEGLEKAAQVGASRPLGQTERDRSVGRHRPRGSAQREPRHRLTPAGGGRSVRDRQRGAARAIRASAKAASGSEERVVAPRVDWQKVTALAAHSKSPICLLYIQKPPSSTFQPSLPRIW